MKIDSGSPVNAISEATYAELIRKNARLFKPKRENRTRYFSYDGTKPMTVVKQFRARVWVHEEKPSLVAEFIVIKGVSTCSAESQHKNSTF